MNSETHQQVEGRDQAFPAANNDCWAGGMNILTHMSLEILKSIIVAGGRDCDYTDEEKIVGAISMARKLMSHLNQQNNA